MAIPRKSVCRRLDVPWPAVFGLGGDPAALRPPRSHWRGPRVRATCAPSLLAGARHISASPITIAGSVPSRSGTPTHNLRRCAVTPTVDVTSSVPSANDASFAQLWHVLHAPELPPTTGWPQTLTASPTRRSSRPNSSRGWRAGPSDLSWAERLTASASRAWSTTSPERFELSPLAGAGAGGRRPVRRLPLVSADGHPSVFAPQRDLPQSAAGSAAP